MRDRNEFILANLIEVRAKQQPDLEWMLVLQSASEKPQEHLLNELFSADEDNIYEWTAT